MRMNTTHMLLMEEELRLARIARLIAENALLNEEYAYRNTTPTGPDKQ